MEMICNLTKYHNQIYQTTLWYLFKWYACISTFWSSAVANFTKSTNSLEFHSHGFSVFRYEYFFFFSKEKRAFCSYIFANANFTITLGLRIGFGCKSICVFGQMLFLEKLQKKNHILASFWKPFEFSTEILLMKKWHPVWSWRRISASSL